MFNIVSLMNIVALYCGGVAALLLMTSLVLSP